MTFWNTKKDYSQNPINCSKITDTFPIEVYISITELNKSDRLIIYFLDQNKRG